jgi:poly [ADP-ribose] polymerase
LQKYLHLLHTHGRSFLVENKVDKKKLLVGIAVLGKLMDLTDPQLEPVYCSKARKRLCTIYESLILTNLSLSDTKDTVRQELESLDLLLKLRDAGEILEKESQSSSLAMSQISQVLGLAKMTLGIYPLCLSLSILFYFILFFLLSSECCAKKKLQSMKLTFLTC